MTWKPDVCVFHGGCDDGFGAAWVISKKWPDVKFVPGFYGKGISVDAHAEFGGKNLLFVDFSLKRDAMKALTQQNFDLPGVRSIVVIDHHKTAEAELAEWDVGPINQQDVLPALDSYILDKLQQTGSPIVAFFDMGHSGAVMAWQFVAQHDLGEVPFALKLIEDRDLWRFNYAETERFSAALRTYPQDFGTWNALLPNPAELVSDGVAILRGHKKLVDQICAERFDMTISGHRVPACNASYHYASDVAHELLRRNPEAPFAVCWFKRADGKFQFSLRSEDGREDVSAIAKAYGGGGHRNAAGFESIDITQPMNPTARG